MLNGFNIVNGKDNWGRKMQTLALLAVDKEKLAPFYSRVPELFEKHLHDSSQNPEQYEELLYKVQFFY